MRIIEESRKQPASVSAKPATLVPAPAIAKEAKSSQNSSTTEGGMKVLNEAVKALEGENDKNQKTSATSKMQTTESRSEHEDDDEEPFEELETVSDCQ